MNWENLLPAIFFLSGLVLKKEILGKNLLKANFYFFLPLLIFKIFSTTQFNFNLFYLSLISFILIILTFIIGMIIFKNENIDQDKGVLIIAPMIMNLSAVYPIVFINFSEKYIQNVAFFDLSNGILTLTLTYAIAIKFGSKRNKINLKKIFSPPLLAIFFGILWNLLNFKSIKIIENLYPIIKFLILFSVYFSLGSLFYFKKSFFTKILKANSIRFIVGFLIALVSGFLFKIDKHSLKILLLCATAPCGFNTLTFSVLENLNTSLAASIVSISLILYFPVAFMIIMI